MKKIGKKAQSGRAIYAQSGNMIFIIMIAIVLLASLTYSMTRSNRSSQVMLSKEQAELAADEIIGYARAVQEGVARVIAQSPSTVEAPVCFASNEWTSGPPNNVRWAYQENSARCSSDLHKVFHPQGGGVRFMHPKSAWLEDYYKNTAPYNTYPETFYFLYTGFFRVAGVGSPKSELVMLQFILKKEVCEAINRKLGLPYDPVPTDDVYSEGVSSTKQFSFWTHALTSPFFNFESSVNEDTGSFYTIGKDFAVKTGLYGIGGGGVRLQPVQPWSWRNQRGQQLLFLLGAYPAINADSPAFRISMIPSAAFAAKEA